MERAVKVLALALASRTRIGGPFSGLGRRPFLVAENGDGVERRAAGAKGEDALLGFDGHAHPNGKGTEGKSQLRTAIAQCPEVPNAQRTMTLSYRAIPRL